MATSRAAWQLEGLSPPAKWLLESVDRQGSRQSDLVPLLAGGARKSVPPAARELERRLLVHASEVHTPSGAHAKVLQTWSRWLAETPLEVQLPPDMSAREQLARVMERINRQCGASARLPWQPSGARKRE